MSGTMRLLQSGGPAFYQGTRAVRIAPLRGGRPAAALWKFWREGNEIYAAHRLGGHTAKISVHASGQIHMHRGPRNLQRFMPAMVLDAGSWHHAFEVRFLLGAGADLPPERLLRLKKRDKALLVDVPDGQVFYLNLLLSAGSGAPSGLPGEFSGASEVWRNTLSDGRSVVLLARVMPFDEQSSAALRYIRSELQPKVNYSGVQGKEPPYVEIMHAFWSNDGNVLLVIPMGPEGRRFDPEPSSDGSAGPTDARGVVVECPDASADLIAPDGSVVGSLSIAGGLARVALVKGREVLHPIGLVTLSIDPSALRWGESFVRPRYELSCAPMIGGAQVGRGKWEYAYELRFDGSAAYLSVGPSSGALRSANMPKPVPELGPGEEIVLRAPAAALVLRATREATTASAELVCSFKLRDA
jgi:hypothetical protein